MRKVSRAEDFQPWVNYRTAASIELPKGHSAADVIRHDKGHDDWHAMYGDSPCKNEDDCARMRAHYKKDEPSNSHHASKEGGEKNSFKPPSGVQSAAKHALELIADGKAGDGFTSVGRHRAKQLAGGGAVPLSDIKRMHAYFSRHAVDKKGKDWDNNSPGKVAWLAWGGDAGASWAASIVKKHGDSKKKEAGAYPSNSEWERHLGNLEALEDHARDGLDWHAQHGESEAYQAHRVAVEAIQQAIHSVRNVMQFPDATKD